MPQLGGSLAPRGLGAVAEKFGVQRYASEFAKLLREVADRVVWGL